MYYIIYMYKDITVHIENIYLMTFIWNTLDKIKFENIFQILLLQTL